MNRKTFRASIELKADGQPGEFKATFATLNVIDLDGDVTLPGAFTDGERVRISHWQHDWNQLPVGKGTIREEADKAVVDGQFFLDTQSGKEHYLTVKALGDLQEWSYGFDILDYSFGEHEGQKVRFLRKLKVHEVSPVMLGAGIDTGTTDIKASKAACPAHSTATSQGTWDGPANEARAKSGETVGYYRRIFAWQDPEGDPGVKSSYRFIHHEVGSDGTPGAANIRACQSGIGILNGGRGGTTIPEEDIPGVYGHMARHLRDAGLEPPPLKGLGPLEACELYLKEGRRNSDADLGRIQRIHDLCAELGAKCAAGEGTTEDEAGDGKSSGPGPSTYGAMIDLEILEAGIDT